MNKRNTTYWTCQILGWGAYSAVGVWITVVQVGWHASIVIGYALFFLYSIGLTHLFRREIRRRQWLKLRLSREIPRLLGVSIVIGLVQGGLVTSIAGALDRSQGNWQPAAVFFLTLNTVASAIGWTTLYATITRNRDIRNTTLQLQLDLREAELRALGAQVNPHFLFNCLNTIRGMIVEDAAQAQDMVTRLANILRYNLQHDRTHTVPLDREIEVVTDYLAIEAIRFEDRLRVKFAIDPAAARALVPSMLLQTLVENALKHGLSNLPEGGELLIHARMEQGTLVLEVENTGHLKQPRPGATQVGLKNARERLRLLYGDRASLTLADRAGASVVATVQIPGGA